MSGKVSAYISDRIKLGDLATWLYEEIDKLETYRRLHVTPLRIAAEKGLDSYDRYDEALDLLGEDALLLLEQFALSYVKEVGPTP